MLTQNILPIYGMAKICLLSTACTSYLDMPFTEPTTVNGVPGTGISAVGVGGLMTAGGYGGIRISLQAAPWTIKTTTVIDQITTPTGGSRIFTHQTAKGWAHAPASTTSSTAQPSGVVQLVTPGQIVSNIPLGSNDKLGGMVITGDPLHPGAGAAPAPGIWRGRPGPARPEANALVDYGPLGLILAAPLARGGPLSFPTAAGRIKARSEARYPCCGACSIRPGPTSSVLVFC